MFAAQVKLTWIGRRAYQRRMRTAFKRYRKARKKQMRKAGVIVRKHIRRSARQRFGKTKVLGRKYKTWVDVKPELERIKIQPKGKAVAYGTVHEYGGTVHRKAHSQYKRGGRAKEMAKRTARKKAGSKHSYQVRAHTAEYRAQPFWRRGVKRSEREVVKALGKIFKAV